MGALLRPRRAVSATSSTWLARPMLAMMTAFRGVHLDFGASANQKCPSFKLVLGQLEPETTYLDNVGQEDFLMQTYRAAT